MKFVPISLSSDKQFVIDVVKAAFSSTSDAHIEDWFSFEEMEHMIDQKRGICIKAISDTNEIVGTLYAQQENPINGKEGKEKWVIVLLAVPEKYSRAGIGSGLLKEIEQQVKAQGAVKLFVYTNQKDEHVIHFYQKNGYKDAGYIRDYQYGKDNSAVFLLKYL